MELKVLEISAENIKQSHKYITGGVISLNRKVNPNLVIRRAKGSKLHSSEGKGSIDYLAAFAQAYVSREFRLSVIDFKLQN